MDKPISSPLAEVRGKEIIPLHPERLASLLESTHSVSIDVGCGDGRLVYRSAKDNPGMLCIGIDPAVEGMREVSWRAGRKPARGGVRNALFLRGTVDTLPGMLAGKANHVSIHFPWNRLLEVLILPDEGALRRLAALGGDGADFYIRLNASVLEDGAYCARLGIPATDMERLTSVLAGEWANAGLRLVHVERVEGEVGPRSTWGRRLTVGAGRSTFIIKGEFLSSCS